MVNAVCNPKMPVSHLTVSTVLSNYYGVQVSYLTQSALNSTPKIEVEKANRYKKRCVLHTQELAVAA